MSSAPDRYEKELETALSLLNWYAPHLGQKFPALDNLCIFPHPEIKGPAAGASPGMVLGVQVKGMCAPSLSAFTPKNLLIMRRMLMPIFWFHVEKGDRNPRRLTYLSPEWLSRAIEAKQPPSNAPRPQIPKLRSVVFKNLLISQSERSKVHKFLADL